MQMMRSRSDLDKGSDAGRVDEVKTAFTRVCLLRPAVLRLVGRRRSRLVSPFQRASLSAMGIYK